MREEEDDERQRERKKEGSKGGRTKGPTSSVEFEPDTFIRP